MGIVPHEVFSFCPERLRLYFLWKKKRVRGRKKPTKQKGSRFKNEWKEFFCIKWLNYLPYFLRTVVCVFIGRKGGRGIPLSQFWNGQTGDVLPHSRTLHCVPWNWSPLLPCGSVHMVLSLLMKSHRLRVKLITQMLGIVTLNSSWPSWRLVLAVNSNLSIDQVTVSFASAHSPFLWWVTWIRTFLEVGNWMWIFCLCVCVK